MSHRLHVRSREGQAHVVLAVAHSNEDGSRLLNRNRRLEGCSRGPDGDLRRQRRAGLRTVAAARHEQNCGMTTGANAPSSMLAAGMADCNCAAVSATAKRTGKGHRVLESLPLRNPVADAIATGAGASIGTAMLCRLLCINRAQAFRLVLRRVANDGEWRSFANGGVCAIFGAVRVCPSTITSRHGPSHRLPPAEAARHDAGCRRRAGDARAGDPALP